MLLFVVSCTDPDDEPTVPIPPAEEENTYFPPLTGDEWATTPIDSLDWNLDKLEELKRFLAEDNARSFMILVNGRIVVEEYFNGHCATDTWEWNSAGKTLVTATTGIAQQEGLINITSKVSDYIGTEWTSAPLEKEALIQPYHLLSMSSGLNDESNFITKDNLTYLADAGTRWSYNNVFQILIDIISEVSDQDFQAYFTEKLESKIGMEGIWNFGPIFKIYHSDTRSMARFGLLALNQGKWEEETIVAEDFFQASVQPSQEINPSYGYMWWLNGQPTFMLSNSQEVFQGSIVPNAPTDMYAAMGFAEQRLYIVPSKKMIVIRMGEASNVSDSDFALSDFDNVFWEKLNEVIN
ncbi:MAG: serine hydrolase domain-containing protein [Thermonemataceae bacterium]